MISRAEGAAASPALGALGSCARGMAGPDSDIDLAGRRFGDVSERRLRRSDGVEVEIGLAPTSWPRTDPVDPGTARVVRDGFSVVLDLHGTLADLATAVGTIDGQ